MIPTSHSRFGIPKTQVDGRLNIVKRNGGGVLEVSLADSQIRPLS